MSATEALSVIDVIAEAFLNDPTWSWAFPDPTARSQWWKFCINEALRYPWTFKTGDFETVSVWIPPSATEFSHDGEQSVPGRLNDLVGARASEVAELWPGRHGHVAKKPIISHIAGCDMEIPTSTRP